MIKEHKEHEQGWHWVPSLHLIELREKITQMNKTAAKLGVPDIELETRATEVIDYKRLGLITWVEVRAHGEQIKLKGWRLAARIEHTGVGNIIYTVPGETVPMFYRRTPETLCEHCGHKRRRKATFIVQHDEGRRKQVGSTCIADFLGHKEPEALVRWLEWLAEGFIGEGDWASEEGLFGSREERTWDTQMFLEATAMVIRAWGWVSKGRAFEEEKRSTVDLVFDYLCPPIHDHDGSERRWREETREKGGTDHTEEVTAAIEWAKAIEPNTESEYLYNIHTLSLLGWVNWKNSGFVASILPSYRRVMNRDAEAKREAKPDSNWVGEIGVRQEFTVTVHSVIDHEGDFGWVGIHKMVDDQGNQMTWFCSGKPLEVDETVKVKATVKGHDTYKGTKQTVVNRVSRVKA